MNPKSSEPDFNHPAFQGVAGRPWALLLPSSLKGLKTEKITSELKQVVATDHVILVTTLQDKNYKLIRRGGKIITSPNIPTQNGNLDCDVKNSIFLANKLGLEKSEHENLFSIDIQIILSALVQINPRTKIILIMIGASELELASEIGKALTGVLGANKSLLIAVNTLDDQSLLELEYCHSSQFIKYSNIFMKENPQTDVSLTPAIVALEYATRQDRHCYAKISDFPHPYDFLQLHFSFPAVVIWQYQPPAFSEAQKNELIALGFDAIRNFLAKGPATENIPDDEDFKRYSGVFITIRQNSNLRGCIGTLYADQPLYRAVQNMSIAAATSDPRFPSLKLEELPQISIKIAVLSPLQPISADQIQIGKHGLLIVHHGRRGVLLPDVPVERGWDTKTFLAHLCLKAGLDIEALNSNPRLYAFTTFEFSSSYQNFELHQKRELAD